MRGREESRVKRLGGGGEEREEEEKKERRRRKRRGRKPKGKGVVARRCGWTRGVRIDSLTPGEAD